MRRRSPYSKQDLPLKCKGRVWKRRSCFLFLVLWCAIFFLGARSASAQENLFPRADGDRARYDVQIDFEKAYLSGVCLMLQEGGIIKASVVNEFGVSALDFSYDLEKKKVKIHHVIANMNKWYIKRILRRDLRKVMSLLADGQNAYEDEKYGIIYTFNPMS